MASAGGGMAVAGGGYQIIEAISDHHLHSCQPCFNRDVGRCITFGLRSTQHGHANSQYRPQTPAQAHSKQSKPYSRAHKNCRLRLGRSALIASELARRFHLGCFLNRPHRFDQLRGRSVCETTMRLAVTTSLLCTASRTRVGFSESAAVLNLQRLSTTRFGTPSAGGNARVAQCNAI